MTSQPIADASPRPLYWSVRRELWENRSIYIAPLIVAAVVLFSFMISTIRLSDKMRGLAALDMAKQRMVVLTPYSLAASVILLSGFIVGAFYCLDALNSERRDRSILFWKSMPVSDRTTVLSKASIPLVVLPLICFAVALTTQTIMLLLSSMVLAGSGLSPAIVWTRLPLLQMTVVMFYGLAAHALWYAPLYSWLLLVSAWARRAAMLWAVLPFVVIGVFAKVALGVSLFDAVLKYRLLGAMVEAFDVNAISNPITRVSQLEPLKFLSSPGLWIGLLLAAAFLAAAVRLRRKREPI
jgi:ABC-2 type transport system permease protein